MKMQPEYESDKRDCYLRLKLSRLSSISEVADSEVLLYERESGNVTDRYTVAVKKSRTIIRHLTRKVLHVCSLFLRRGGTVRCTMTGITTN